MAANGTTNISFSQPTDPALEMQDIARKRKLAEALQAQAAQPMGGTDMVGGWAIKKSPLEGIGKMAQALSGSYQQSELDKREKTIAAESRTKDRAERERIIASLTNPGMPVVADPNAPQQPQWMAAAPSSTMNDGMPAGAPTAPNARPLSPAQSFAATLARSENPAYAQMGMTSLMAALSKDPASSAFQKIDPKDYTSGSVAKFSQTHDYADLVPVRKKELANLGGTSRLYDPYADSGDLTHTVKPDTTAQLAQSQQHWSNISPYQQQTLGLDRARVANQGIETQFNTGRGVTGPVGAPPMPQIGAPVPAGAPVMPSAVAPPAAGMPSAQSAPAPRVAPVAAPNDGLTPKARVDVAASSAKNRNEMENKRDFNMTGLGSVIDEARGVLTGQGGKLPTSSGAGSIVDSVGGFFGIAPKGAPEAAQLKAIGGALVAKMPRMEGPQSDKDVLNYKEMAGQVGDPTIPLAVRVKALEGVEALWRKYDKGEAYGIPGAPPIDFQDRRAKPRSGNRVVVDY